MGLYPTRSPIAIPFQKNPPAKQRKNGKAMGAKGGRRGTPRR